MPEDRTKPVTEVWVTASSKRYRVYRGQNKDHIAWKVDHHEREGHQVSTNTAVGDWNTPPLELPQ